jgi:hypothetical protein
MNGSNPPKIELRAPDAELFELRATKLSFELEAELRSSPLEKARRSALTAQIA